MGPVLSSPEYKKDVNVRAACGGLRGRRRGKAGRLCTMGAVEPRRDYRSVNPSGESVVSISFGALAGHPCLAGRCRDIGVGPRGQVASEAVLTLLTGLLARYPQGHIESRGA